MPMTAAATLAAFVEQIIEKDAPGEAPFSTVDAEGNRVEVHWTRTEYGSDREGLDLFLVVRPEPGRTPAVLATEVMYHDLDHEVLARLAAAVQPGKTAQDIELAPVERGPKE
jgi:hypothetical protein